MRLGATRGRLIKRDVPQRAATLFTTSYDGITPANRTLCQSTDEVSVYDNDRLTKVWLKLESRHECHSQLFRGSVTCFVEKSPLKPRRSLR
jgi:hypothetical protein